MNQRPVDFLVIGAGKAGTTSLFRYLDAHPAIAMPPHKEIAFFADDEAYAKGIGWYRQHWPPQTEHGVIRGEASPQYMQSEAAAARIRDAAPEVKLITVLRDPVQRAFAHYRHARRKGIEPRGFEAVCDAWLSGALSGPAADYFEASRYHSVLRGYAACFHHSQIKIVFTEQLSSQPLRIVQELYGWLGVDANVAPACIGEVFNGGASSNRWNLLSRTLTGAMRGFRRATGFRGAVEETLPAPMARAYRSLRLSMLTASRAASDEVVPDAVQSRLWQAYSQEVASLTQDFNVRPPWRQAA